MAERHEQIIQQLNEQYELLYMAQSKLLMHEQNVKDSSRQSQRDLRVVNEQIRRDLQAEVTAQEAVQKNLIAELRDFNKK